MGRLVSGAVVAAVVAAAVAALGGAGLAACVGLRADFACSEPADCVDGLVAGTCEPTGFCSFPDATCSGTGRRYGDLAGRGLGGTCVDGGDAGLPDGPTDGPADGGSDAPPEGGPDDAGGDAGDGGGDAGDGGLVNLVSNPGCENGFTGWDGYQATLSTSTTAHSGTYSCQACLDSGFTEFTFDDDDQVGSVVSSPQAGEVYRASAWVRSSGGPAGQEVSIALREWDSAGSVSSRHTISELLVLTTSWQYLEVTHTVEADSYALDTFIGNAAARAGDCFLVDDYAVVRLQ